MQVVNKSEMLKFLPLLVTFNWELMWNDRALRGKDIDEIKRDCLEVLMAIVDSPKRKSKELNIRFAIKYGNKVVTVDFSKTSIDVIGIVYL